MKGAGLIVPDVHEKIEELKRILEKYSDRVDWVLFLGDFFDSFDGLTESTHETARWVAANVDNPTYTCLYGNHDLHYSLPVDGIICSGYTSAKQKVINNYVKRKHWNRFRLMKWVTSDDEPWLCSHAGIHETLLHPTLGYDKDALHEMEMMALNDLAFGSIHPLVAIGQGRGGWAKRGGVDWLDWNTEFVPIEGLNQIVGHTPFITPRWKNTSGSQNLCLDTHLHHVFFMPVDQPPQIHIAEFGIQIGHALPIK